MDELERALFARGITVTPDELNALRDMVAYAGMFTSDPINAVLAIVTGGQDNAKARGAQ